MTELLIAAAVLLLILLILVGRVTVIFDYGEELYLNVSYLMFTVMKIPNKREKSPKKRKRTKKRSEKAEKSEKTEKSKKAEKSEKTKKTKPGLSDIFTLVKLAADSVGKPLKRILKRTRISRLQLDIICGGEDAAKAALNFGRMNIVVGNALGWIDSFFTLKPVERININVDFEREETEYYAYCEIQLSLAAALGFLFSVIGRAVKYYGGHKDAKIALKKMLGK